MKKKINLYFMMIAVVSIFATMFLVSIVCYNLFKKQVTEDLKTYAYLLKDTKALEELIENNYESGQNQLRVTLVGDDGSVLYESYADAEKMNNHSTRPEIKEALLSGEGQAVRKSATLDKNTFYFAIKMDDGTVVRVAKEADSIWSVFAGSFPAIITIGIVLIIFCMVSVGFLARSLISPIEKIAKNVDNLEDLNTYEELIPFITTIHKQHEDILRSAGMRQEFTANVSHELKTPLTSISGYSELIENGMASQEDMRRFAKEIHRNSDRLLTLINDVIRLSELDVVDIEEPHEQIDLYDIAETCISMLQLNAENHGVTLKLEGESSIVQSTKQMMEELVFNLCDNAIRYNVEEGRVNVSVRPNGENILLIVEDTGIGISKEHQERIFERFYRVDKSRSKSTGGTGLGLAIVKHIVAKNNAEISLESMAGKGTRITVVFPKHD